MFWNGGCQGSDNAAGFLKHAKFQCDRRADGGFLPFKRHRQAARPFHPVFAGPLLPVERDDVDRVCKRLVSSEDKGDVLFKEEAGA